MSLFLTATTAMVALGLMFGAGLALASRMFTVRTDERVENILAALPGTNCGACGYGGCIAYALAVVNEGEQTGLCVPGGSEAAAAVAQVMGVDATESAGARRAVVHCQGDAVRCGQRGRYSGIDDCRAAHLTSAGARACTYGCLGYGACARACPFDAIVMEAGLAHVDVVKCTGCGVCVRACPRDLISLLDLSYDTYLGCSSRDSGKAVKGVCEVGCITCGACAKKDPNGAVTMKDGLPLLDYGAGNGDFSVAAEVCPMACFVVGQKSGGSE